VQFRCHRYGQAGTTTSTFVPGVSGSWDLDVWGKVRRQIESNASAAQVSAADLDNVKLSAQAQLATAYFNLRAADALQALLLRTVQEYKKTLEIVRNQFKGGLFRFGGRRCDGRGPGLQHAVASSQCRCATRPV